MWNLYSRRMSLIFGVAISNGWVEEMMVGQYRPEEEGMEYEIAHMRDVIPNRDSTKDSKFKLTYWQVS